MSVVDNQMEFSIHLFTTKKGSAQKRPSKGLEKGLTEVINNIINPLKNTTIEYYDLPEFIQYQATLEKIRKECGLERSAFSNFLRKLEFQFSQEPIEQIKNVIQHKLVGLGIEETLYEKLLDGVVNWSISGEKITKPIVLQKLGILSRFEDKLSHHFRIVDNKFYIPNVDLLNKIEDAIENLSGGYIFIEGLPGIGKSTALTKFKELNTDIAFTYYCFIPDVANDFGELRHKSEYFLKSMCVAIENQFPEVDLPMKYSDRYEEKLASYIDKLGTLDRKIIFVIDGLDHVHRDIDFQENSLLNQIKGQLPNGIYFLLSSQYKTVLSDNVLTQIKSDPRRHIVVSRFSQPQIIQYLSNKGIKANNIIDHVEEVSGGIPLYLHYISELLLQKETTEYEDVIKILPTLTKGQIDSYHEYLFSKIAGNEFVKMDVSCICLPQGKNNCSYSFRGIEICRNRRESDRCPTSDK